MTSVYHLSLLFCRGQSKEHIFVHFAMTLFYKEVARRCHRRLRAKEQESSLYAHNLLQHFILVVKNLPLVIKAN